MGSKTPGWILSIAKGNQNRFETTLGNMVGEEHKGSVIWWSRRLKGLREETTFNAMQRAGIDEHRCAEILRAIDDPWIDKGRVEELLDRKGL